MALRVRNLRYIFPEMGTTTWNGIPFSPQRAFGHAGSCVDVCDQPQKDHPLTLEKWGVKSFVPWNGTSGVSSYTDYPPSCVSLGAPSLPAIQTSHEKFRNAASAIASHNPSEAPVSIPVFLYEMKDIPQMLKHAWNRANLLAKAAGSNRLRSVRKYLKNPKNPAEDWLNWNFGWRPLLNDLSDIGDVAQWAQHRARVHEARTKKYLSRRSGLGTCNYRSTINHSQFCAFVGAYCVVVEEQVSKRWCSSRWKHVPVSWPAVLQSKHPELFRVAQAIHGNVSLADAWEMMPWSWLIDWFSNIGSVIHTMNNRLGIQFDGACVMTHRRIERTLTPKQDTAFLKKLSVGPAVLYREQKLRDISASPLHLALLGTNALGANQLATLSSLLVTRMK